MELARVQSAIARLAVDRELRATFLDEPAAAADRLGLTVREAEQLAQRVAGLGPFADSLIRKRLAAARRLLPRTARRLDRRFDEEFRRFAATQPSQGPRRHERDALALAARLLPSLDGEDRETLIVESGWIEAALARRLIVRRFARGRFAFALWLPIGRRTLFWRFGRRPDWTNEAPAAQESDEGIG